MTAMTVTTSRISTDEFLSGDYPTGSELIDGVVHIEVRSPGTRHLDIGRKLATYHDAGTRELWLVDTPARGAPHQPSAPRVHPGGRRAFHGLISGR